MDFTRTLTLLVALLPSAAGAVSFRVDFTVQDAELFVTGDGASLVSLPADRTLRGSYTYDDTPLQDSQAGNSSRTLQYLDGVTGASVAIGSDVFTIVTGTGAADVQDFLAIFFYDDELYIDEEDPSRSLYIDAYRVVA